MAKTFTVAGVTFDTAEALEGWYEQKKDLSRRHLGIVHSFACEKFISLAAPEAENHKDLSVRYRQLLQNTQLTEMPKLRIGDYNFCHVGKVHWENDGLKEDIILVDRAVLALLNPDELDAVIAHELAHAEKGTQESKDSIKREFEADKRAAEICGKPEALSSALGKIEAYWNAFTKSSYKVQLASGIQGFRRLYTDMRSRIIDGNGPGIHPPDYQRREKLRRLAENTSSVQQRDGERGI